MPLMNYSYLRTLKVSYKNFLPLLQIPQINHESVRHRTQKHWNQKYRKLRAQKVIKIDIPDYYRHLTGNKITPEEERAKMKERGLQPRAPWLERPFYLSCTGTIFEPYVPPEGDGKKSAITLPGAKQKYEFLEKKSKSYLAIRKIKTFDENFNTEEFLDQAQETYIKSHELLTDNNDYEKIKDSLRDYVTEKALQDMMNNILYKTIRWKFFNSLEPSRIVHARCTSLITKDNVYAQITVRFHSQQMLAIYDRFGRLMYGSEILAKDVLEYVVYEKHLANVYGKWRLHDKIINEQTLKNQEPANITYVEKPEEKENTTKPENEKEEKQNLEGEKLAVVT